MVSKFLKKKKIGFQMVVLMIELCMILGLAKVEMHSYEIDLILMQTRENTQTLYWYSTVCLSSPTRISYPYRINVTQTAN